MPTYPGAHSELRGCSRSSLRLLSSHRARAHYCRGTPSGEPVHALFLLSRGDGLELQSLPGTEADDKSVRLSRVDGDPEAVMLHDGQRVRRHRRHNPRLSPRYEVVHPSLLAARPSSLAALPS